MTEVLQYLLAAGALVGLWFLLRSRFAWLFETVAAPIVGWALIFGLFYFVGDLIRNPNPVSVYFLAMLLFLPSLLLGALWLESSEPDPFKPVPEETVAAFADVIERIEGHGFRLQAAAVRRWLGLGWFIFVNPADQIIALLVGNRPGKASLWLYSKIAGYEAVLSTANHRPGSRAPGDLRQWLPGKQLPELVAAHKNAADFLKSRGFEVGADLDDDPLDFLRLLTDIERQNRRRPGRHLLDVAFGDLLAPRIKPLAEQRRIRRRLTRLPTR